MKLNIQLFANTITTTITDGIYDTQEGNYENKSYVGITAYFKAGSSETWFNSKTIYFYCKRVNPDGTETDITPINWDGNQKARTMTCSLSKGGSVSKTFYFYFVDHQTDGSLKVRCYWTIATGTSQLGTITESQTQKTQVMATIPRGSTFDLSGWNRDTQRNFSSTISLPAIQNLTTAYHKLEAKFYRQDTQQEQLIATRTFGNISGNSISFTFSNGELSTIYNLMPSETTHYIRMYLTTYSDSGRTHQVGDVSALWWTGLIPTSVVPTATRTFAENGATPSAWNTYVKTKSKVRVITTTTPAYGSPITSITTTCDGYTYTGADFTTNYLNTAGTLSITTKITDSRGRSSTYTSNISVVDYYNPSFGTIQIQRCDVNGNIDDNGTYVYFYFNGSVAPCNNHNTGTFVIKYKIHSASVYTEKTISSNVSSLNTNGFITDNNNTKVQFSTTDSYDFIFYISDYFTSSTTNKTLETGFDLMNFNASGKAMAIGKVSEAGANEELFEVGIKTNIENDLDIVQTYPQLLMNGNSTIRMTDGLYVGGYGSYIVLRPNGMWNATGQMILDTGGNVSFNGEVITSGGKLLSTIFVDGERTWNDPPSGARYYMNTQNIGAFRRFKDGGYIGLSSIWTGVEIIKPYVDTSGGPMHEIAYNSDGLFYRKGKTDDSDWEVWAGLDHTRVINFNGEWRAAFNPYGAGWRIWIPFISPKKTLPTLNLTSCSYYGTAGWKSCSASVSWQTETECCIEISGITDSETRSWMVLISMQGTLKLGG